MDLGYATSFPELFENIWKGAFGALAKFGTQIFWLENACIGPYWRVANLEYPQCPSVVEGPPCKGGQTLSIHPIGLWILCFGQLAVQGSYGKTAHSLF